jgi:hypothetical protein
MANIKRFLGLIWMALGPLAIIALIYSAYITIDPAGKAEINKPLPWIIIIFIFTPIAIGLSIFGWYVWKGDLTPTLSIKDGEGENAEAQQRLI